MLDQPPASSAASSSCVCGSQPRSGAAPSTRAACVRPPCRYEIHTVLID